VLFDIHIKFKLIAEAHARSDSVK